MSEAFGTIPGGGGILIIADHASNHVPADIDLGIDPALLGRHVAIDIGVAEVAALLAARLDAGAVLGGVSRLVIDLNREEDAANLIPLSSDGQAVPGNMGADRAGRIARFHAPYHAAVTAAIDALIDAGSRPFLISLHSFTPRLESDPGSDRPWDIGILYNRDDRAARIAIPLLAAAGLMVGDQLPYSGVLLNATMNRHAEARGLPYLGIEMRQDHVSGAAGQRAMAEILAPVIAACRNGLAPEAPF